MAMRLWADVGSGVRKGDGSEMVHQWRSQVVEGLEATTAESRTAGPDSLMVTHAQLSLAPLDFKLDILTAPTSDLRNSSLV